MKSGCPLASDAAWTEGRDKKAIRDEARSGFSVRSISQRSRSTSIMRQHSWREPRVGDSLGAAGWEGQQSQAHPMVGPIKTKAKRKTRIFFIASPSEFRNEFQNLIKFLVSLSRRTGTDRFAHASLEVPAENLVLHLFNRALDRAEDLKNFHAVASFFDHLLDASDLTFNLPKPVEFFFVRRVRRHFVTCGKGTIPPQGMSSRLSFHKSEDRGVDAVVLMGGRGAVVEEVAQVRIAAGAKDFRPMHKEAGIIFKSNVLRRHRS